MDLEECVKTLFKEESSDHRESGDTNMGVATFTSGQQSWSSSDSPSTNNNSNNNNNVHSSSSEGSEPSDSSDSEDTSVFLFPESVQAIAETVGVELDEDAAELIGQEAINKLRHLTLLALQFSRHYKSKALRVIDVSKAEKILDSSSSLGHGMNVNPPNFINLGGLCSEDEGPEIDLVATINDPSTNTVTIDSDADPIVQSHFCHYHDHLTEKNDTKMKQDMEEEEGEEEDDQRRRQQQQQQQNDGEKKVENSKSVHDYDQQLPIEWADYLKHFLIAFYDKKQKHCRTTVETECMDDDDEGDGNEQKDKEKLPKELDDFQIVLADVAQNGVFPILDIICDFFHDFLNGHFSDCQSNKQLKRIPVFIDTILGCPIRSKSHHLKLMSEVLNSMIRLPVPSTIEPYVTRTLLKIKNYGGC